MSDGDFDPEDIVDPLEKALERRAESAKARATLVSAKHCLECAAAIPEARRNALPGVRYCIDCQIYLDALEARRGSG